MPKQSTRVRKLARGLRKVNTNLLKRSAVAAYNVGMGKIESKAKRNAPKKSGRLASSIKSTIRTPKGARGGILLRGYVHSHRIYDKMQHASVPNGGLTRTEANNLSRKWRGKSHRVRTGVNYAKKQGNRKWAWGRRQGKKYMTQGQDFKAVNRQIAVDLGRNIANQFKMALRSL